MFAGHMFQSTLDLPFKLKTGKTKYENFLRFLKILAMFCLAPIAELISLSLFIYYFKFPNSEKQVEWNINRKSSPIIFVLV